MRQPWLLPAAVALALLAGFTAGIVYSDSDLKPWKVNPSPDKTAPAVEQPKQPEQQKPPEPKQEPAPKAIPRTGRGTLDQQSDAIHAAKAKAVEMMTREKVPQPVQEWINHFLNRGLVNLPTLTDDEMKLARSLLGRNEILEWEGLDIPYLLERAGYEIPESGPIGGPTTPKGKTPQRRP